MGSRTWTVTDRFARFVPSWGCSDGCWEWTGATVGHMGYGWMRFDGRSQLAHRVSFLVYQGEIPDGMQVMHTCDNPLCVRPDHLCLGTDDDNKDDMVAKGRSRIEQSVPRQQLRAAALAKPCPICGGPRKLQGAVKMRVRCPKNACRGGQ